MFELLLAPMLSYAFQLVDEVKVICYNWNWETTIFFLKLVGYATSL
jgi:hypothetical protein